VFPTQPLAKPIPSVGIHCPVGFSPVHSTIDSTWNRYLDDPFALACNAVWSFRTFSGVSRLTPISRLSLFPNVCLEPRPLPSTGITRRQRYYGPIRHPAQPGLSLAGVRLEVTPFHRAGFPVLRKISLCMHAVATTPAEPQGVFARQPLRRRPSPIYRRVGFRIYGFRGLLSVHSRYGLHARRVTKVTFYTRGFSSFVASTTAPIATGWSDSCRVGFAPTRDQTPLHGAQHISHYVPSSDSISRKTPSYTA